MIFIELIGGLFLFALILAGLKAVQNNYANANAKKLSIS